jgi:hypothetical protein
VVGAGERLAVRAEDDLLIAGAWPISDRGRTDRTARRHLMALEEKMTELRDHFGLSPDDLNAR